MTDHEYINQGILEAAEKHSGGMSQIEVADQYRAIQARPVAPFVSPPEHAKDLTPIAVGAAKVVGVVAVVAIMGKVFVVGVTTVFLIIEANAMYAVAAVVGGVALFGLSASRSSGGSSSENPTYSNRRSGGDTHNHYYQNNSFGGGANQTNQ
jgi:hypothetical protein